MVASPAPKTWRKYRNSLRVEGDTAYLRLTPPERDLWVAIDLADLDLARSPGVAWHASGGKGWLAAYTQIRVARGKFLGISLHRLLMAAPEELEVDHINGDTLNCRRSNMRLATKAQNAQNKRPSGRNSSGYRGVNIRRKVNRYGSRYTYWRGSVKVGGKSFERMFPFTDEGKQTAIEWVRARRRELMPYATD